jgi:hypothetical protein
MRLFFVKYKKQKEKSGKNPRLHIWRRSRMENLEEGGGQLTLYNGHA